MNKAIVEITSFGPRRTTWKHGLVCHNGRRRTRLKWPHAKRYLNWTNYSGNLRGCSETPDKTSRKLKFQECTREKYLRVSKAKKMNSTDCAVTALEARCQIMLQRTSTNFSPTMPFWCSFPTKAWFEHSVTWRTRSWPAELSRCNAHVRRLWNHFVEKRKPHVRRSFFSVEYCAHYELGYYMLFCCHVLYVQSVHVRLAWNFSVFCACLEAFPCLWSVLLFSIPFDVYEVTAWATNRCSHHAV